jgi:hypothetical protein
MQRTRGSDGEPGSERAPAALFLCVGNDPAGWQRSMQIGSVLCRKEQRLHTAVDRKKKMKINEGPNEI